MLQAMKLSKVKWIPVLWLAGIFSSQAQNSDERPLSDSAKVTKQADLSEVVIRGERMVTKHDRRLYYPTSEELERSPTVLFPVEKNSYAWRTHRRNETKRDEQPRLCAFIHQ